MLQQISFYVALEVNWRKGSFTIIIRDLLYFVHYFLPIRLNSWATPKYMNPICQLIGTLLPTETSFLLCHHFRSWVRKPTSGAVVALHQPHVTAPEICIRFWRVAVWWLSGTLVMGQSATDAHSEYLMVLMSRKNAGLSTLLVCLTHGVWEIMDGRNNEILKTMITFEFLEEGSPLLLPAIKEID